MVILSSLPMIGAGVMELSAMTQPALVDFDADFSATGLIAGVDEVGRGPLAGPVVAAAVVLQRGQIPQGLADSKTLKPSQRETIAAVIRDQARAWAVAAASVEEIDRLNILQASLLAMRRAVGQLDPAPALLLIDGNRDPNAGIASRLIIGGDGRSAAIAAASILAKTARDAMMAELDRCYPGYGWARNAGYGVPAHLEALRRLGPSPVHRRSFAPVARLLAPAAAKAP